MEEEMNSGFIYHARCLLRSKKDGEIGGKQMAKRINYMKKNHVTCQIYTLFYVELRCWNWILKTLYIINTFQASSVWGFLLRPVLIPQKSNKQFVHDVWSHFNLILVRIKLGVCGENQRGKRRKEKQNINHSFHFSYSVKEPHDEGLRGQPENTSVAKWGEKNTHEEFSYPLRLTVLGRRVK